MYRSIAPALASALRCVCTAMALTAASLTLAQAPAPGGAERARAAVKLGQALPLAQLLATVERSLAGRSIEVELDDDDGELVYELTWLLPDGRVLELEIDARSGQWLQLKGKQLETVFKRPGGDR